MKKILLLSLKIVGGLLATVVVLLLVLGVLLNTNSFQNKLLRYSTQMLSEKLNTEVKIDSVSIGFFSNDVRLKGVSIDDLEHRKMLQMERLTVSMEMLALLNKEVKITSAHVVGLSAELYKPKEGPANYQFVIDAFKKDKQPKDSVEKKKAGSKLALSVSKVVLERICLKYNESSVSLSKLEYKETIGGKRTARLEGLHAQWVAHLKKGPQDCKAGIGVLELQEKDKKGQAAIGNLYFWNDNHLPRKNKGKPKRGAFDNGHMDWKANLKLSFTIPANDRVVAKIERCQVDDDVAGIHVKDLTLGVTATKEKLAMENIVVSLENTTVNIADAELQLPSKKRGVKLGYKTSLITGQTLLKDISQPFAPVLKKFSLPVKFSTYMSGDDYEMKFDKIQVATLDNKLYVEAVGDIKELKDKYKLKVNFHVSKMHAKGDVKTRIINQFPVKKFMMKQVDALGNISCVGDIKVLWKREFFQGVLNTAVGKLDFSFGINEDTKYLSGTIKSKGVDLDRAFDLNGFGKISCTADFTFDISKPRTALMRQKKGGKLPIGNVSAHVDEASYKKVKFRNIVADIVSDGAVAEGKLAVKGKRRDLLCSFSFTNTETLKNKLKVKPGIRFHGLSEEDKQAKAERKQKKAEEKEARRQQRAKEKAQEAEEKAAKKAAKKAQREAEKALKNAEKARKAEAEAAEKAAKKARKAEEKARRAAEKAAKSE